jgi:iron(III) transport system permease protein
MRRAVTDLGRAKWPAFVAVLTYILLTTVTPVFATLSGSLMRRWGFFGISNPWTLDHWREVLGDSTFTSALLTTVEVGLLAAVSAAAMTFCVAYLIVRGPRHHRSALEFVSWLPWAIPGVLLSLGLLSAVLQLPPLHFLHGTLLIVVVAIVLLGFPLGVNLIRGGLLQVSRELEEASYMSGATRRQTYVRILLPLLRPMLLVVGLLTFIAALNEVSSVVLLADINTRTLSLLSLNLLTSNGGKEGAAVVNCVIVVMAVGVALIARALGLRFNNVGN